MPNTKTIKIEWRQSSPGDARMTKILKSLCAALRKKKVAVILIKKKFKTEEILFNDLPLEFLLDEARVKDNFCGAFVTPAQRFKKIQNISEALMRKAAFKAAGILERK